MDLPNSNRHARKATARRPKGRVLRLFPMTSASSSANPHGACAGGPNRPANPRRFVLPRGAGQVLIDARRWVEVDTAGFINRASP